MFGDLFFWKALFISLSTIRLKIGEFYSTQFHQQKQTFTNQNVIIIPSNKILLSPIILFSNLENHKILIPLFGLAEKCWLFMIDEKIW